MASYSGRQRIMPRGRLYVIVLITLVIILAINNALMKPIKRSSTPHAARQDAPELTLPLEAGKPAVALSSLKGKVVILDFWATWCGPCRESIPDVEHLYEKYHGQGLEVVGISMDDTMEPVPQTVKQLGMTYPVVLGRDIPDLRSKFEVRGIPQMYVVDKQGQIAAAFEGYDPSRDMEAEIKPLLAE